MINYSSSVKQYALTYNDLSIKQLMKTHQSRLHTIHQVDSIYLGQLNNSYQKDGFGIQQSFDFNTYIGYWRNNKAQGLGLIFLNPGTIIYGNFYRDSIDGLVIFDDGNLLICGIYRNKEMIGVGFEYNYHIKTWKMNRYHKGYSIQTIKQEFCDISTNQLPKIVHVEQSIYFHLYNYLQRKYFEDLQMQIVEQITSQTFLYGLKIDKKFYGPTVTIRNYEIVEAGFYDQGLLHGFAMKYSQSPFSYELGCYDKGRKNGPHLQKNQKDTKYYEYKKGTILKNLPPSDQVIYRNQKKYNYECKDFFSAKNTLPFDEFKRNSFTKDLKDYKQKKNQFEQKNMKKVTPKKNNNLSPPQRNKDSKASPTRAGYIVSDHKSKSSVQIIKDKINHYYGIVSGKRKSAEKNSRSMITNEKMDRGDRGPNQITSFEIEDDVAKQENPFD